ncbi:hypothetical protein DCAR_0205758 [Daucus carota subsp. sativus]|uniref:MULE transposase domain-containing protein n=1 Tax=Daucus carota subsp. sativus TaxID=79200 RepID=A0AAF0WCZ5_DAUCS|nr:hypothetical protein DCAR_0205758 [Daucus carota subsp. sativus]
MHAPRTSHWSALQHTLRYLAGTATQGILLKASDKLKLQAFSDADWASCVDTRRSVTGYILLFGNSPITWKSKKQSTVSKSSAEAEYRAMASAAAEVTWVVRLLEELGVSNLKHVELHCDNQGLLNIQLSTLQLSLHTKPTQSTHYAYAIPPPKVFILPSGAKIWIPSSMGRAPTCVITDQCPAIKKAIQLNWTDTKHRLCVWHIMNKLPAQMLYVEITHFIYVLPLPPSVSYYYKNLNYEGSAGVMFECIVERSELCLWKYALEVAIL